MFLNSVVSGHDRHYNSQRLLCVSLLVFLSLPFSLYPTSESFQIGVGRKENSHTHLCFAMESRRRSVKEKAQEEEEEEQAVVLKTTKVVEYLVPKMSIELLCKFPDNSAYDFDYSQSTIWSPLLPTPCSPMNLDLITPKKLSYEMGLGARCSVKKMGSKLRKKFNLNVHFINKHGKSKNKKLSSDFSPTPFKGACNPIMNKVTFVSVTFYFRFEEIGIFLCKQSWNFQTAVPLRKLWLFMLYLSFFVLVLLLNVAPKIR